MLFYEKQLFPDFFLLPFLHDNKQPLLLLVIPVAQMVENLPIMQETQGLSLGWEDPLEKGMATHSSILA